MLYSSIHKGASTCGKIAQAYILPFNEELAVLPQSYGPKCPQTPKDLTRVLQFCVEFQPTQVGSLTNGDLFSELHGEWRCVKWKQSRYQVFVKAKTGKLKKIQTIHEFFISVEKLQF